MAVAWANDWSKSALICCAFAGSASVPLVGCGSTGSNAVAGNTGGTATKSEGGAAPSSGGNASDHSSGGRSGNSAGGSGGAVAGGASAVGGFSPEMGGSAPPDTRPSPPDWQPPFALGAPGWRESSAPLCLTRQGSARAVEVWADSRGVFSLVAENCRLTDGDMPFCPPENGELAGTNLQFNDGSGWRPWLDTGTSFLGGLSGFPEGRLLLAGFSDCGLAFIDGPASGTCLIPPDESGEQVTPFAVDAQHAYALRDKSVYEFRAERFENIGELPEPAAALWANSEVVILVGFNQAVYSKSANKASFERLARVPAGNYAAVWGFGAHDIWLANSAAQLVHYDGATFRVLDLGITELNDTGARSLWGSGDTLYWLSETAFGRVRNGESETLLALPAPSASGLVLSDLWGTSENDVFLTGSDWGLDRFACGGEFLLWFDGSEFHRF